MVKKWDDARHLIVDYYLKQNLPLREVMVIMKERHGFQASMRAYRQKFHDWDIRKYRRHSANISDNDSSSSDMSASQQPPLHQQPQETTWYPGSHLYDDAPQAHLSMARNLSPNMSPHSAPAPQFDTFPTSRNALSYSQGQDPSAHRALQPASPWNGMRSAQHWPAPSHLAPQAYARDRSWNTAGTSATVSSATSRFSLPTTSPQEYGPYPSQVQQQQQQQAGYHPAQAWSTLKPGQQWDPSDDWPHHKPPPN